MAMESYRHVEHASFDHLKKNLKNEGFGTKKVDFSAFYHALLIFQPVFYIYNMGLESYWYLDYTSFVRFEISHKMKVLDQKEKFAKSYFSSRAFIFWYFLR